MPPNPAATASVSATLEYLRDAQCKPVTYVPAPPDEHDRKGAEYVAMPVTIHDARGRPAPATLDAEGYRLVAAPSAMRTFTDADEIRRVYYPEMEELARAATAHAWPSSSITSYGNGRRAP
jgi:hypothetical protein